MNCSIKEVIDTYIDDPIKRTKDNIYNNIYFIENLKEKLKDPFCEKVDKDTAIKFMALLGEEELRRYNIKLNDYSNLETYLSEILNIDLQKYVINYIDDLYDKMLDSDIVLIEEYFQNKIKAMIKVSTDDVFDEYLISNLSDKAKKLFTVYKMVFYKHILPFLKFASFVTDEQLEFTGLYCFGIDNDYKMMTLIIQNTINNSDKKMIKSIKNNEYCDFMDDYNYYLQECVERIIKIKRENMIDKITDKGSEYDLDEILLLFKETNNMNTVAGILKGLDKDDILLDEIINLLQNGDCTQPKHKINMIRKGTYLDIILICDSEGYTNKWNPNNETLEKLIKNNKDNMIKSEWIGMFPNKMSYISKIYDQL